MEKFSSYVKDVSWERIHMFVTVEVQSKQLLSENVKFFLINSDFLVETEFKILMRKENEFLITINVTNSGINRCVNNGEYTILIVDGKERFSEVGYVGTSHTLESWGRTFRYLNNVGAYTVTCLMDEFSEESRFQLLFYNTVRRGMSHISALSVVQPNSENKLILKIKSYYKRKIESRAYRVGYRFLHKIFYRKNSKKILFLSEQDDKLALNMQMLIKRMKERHLDSEYRFDYSLRKATSEKQTLMSNFGMIKKIAGANLIIVDDHVPFFDKVAINKDTNIIQIWHAGAGFKGVGYSRWGHCGCPGPYSCHRQYDFCISGSSNISEFFSEQFGILDEQIIPTGMPRMDSYLNKENRENMTKKLYEMYPEAKGKKVLLFAPTYRGQNRSTAYYPYEIIDFEGLYQFCNKKDYVVFFKMHPWVSEAVPIQEKYKDKFFDLNTYSNINDLFYITDLLITDYSSSIYEFSLMRKPMLFFAYDKVQYSASRGFHRDYDSTVPGKVCETFEDVMDALWNGDFEFEKVEKYIKEHFDFVDDHASDRIIDWLILGNLPKVYQEKLDEKKAQVEAVRGVSYADLFLDKDES